MANEYSKAPDNIMLIGHSIRGQLTGMSQQIHSIKQAIFVACLPF
jgi:hypothetical protein